MKHRFNRPAIVHLWVPLGGLLILATAAVMIWQALLAREREHVRQLAAAEAGKVKEQITENVQTHLLALMRMARRLEYSREEPLGQPADLGKQWSRDAELYVQHQAGYRAVVLMDSAYEVQAVVPVAGNEGLLGTVLARQPRVERALDGARQSRGTKVSRTFELPTGGKGFVVVVPIVAQGEITGFVTGVFDLQQLLDSALRDDLAAGFYVAVFDASRTMREEIYQGGQSDVARHSPQEAAVDLDGIPWTICVWPTTQLLSWERTILPEVTLVAGLLVAFLLAAALYEFKRARVWAHRLGKTHVHLERIEQRHRLTLENCLDAFIAIDQAGVVQEWNVQAEHMFGWSSQQVLGRPLHETIIPPEHREAHRRGLQHFLETGEGPLLNRRIEVEAVRKDDSRFPIELTITPVETSEGFQFTAFIRDLTERKQAEATRRRLAAMVESSDDAILGKTLDGMITSWNVGAERLYGYAAEEVIGRHVATLVPEDRQDEIPMLLDRIRCGEATEHFETVRKRRDGTLVDVSVTISPIKDEGGQIIGASSIARDITPQKRTEAELRSLNETLEQRVSARTRELQATLDELRRAKETAEGANRAKSVFLASMSHEIRTPLNAVIGMTELLRDTRLTDIQREYLELVHESGESLLTVINDILDFSKIEAGRLEFERVTFDHAELVGDAMKSLALRAHAKGLELTSGIARDVPYLLLGDPIRLRQVLINLVGNAVKFTERGEVVVQVESVKRSPSESIPEPARSCTAQADIGDRRSIVELHYAIRDTGIGIAAAKVERIFEAFEQADGSTTRRFGGTGLGLAISARLVEMMGGRIWVESEPGRGSTFHFTACFDAPLEQPALPRPAAASALYALPVLVVDDNGTNRCMLAETLAAWGMAPTMASSAEQALAAMRNVRPPVRLIITDAHMPDIDGFELVRRIHQDPELSAGTVILMLSSGDRPGDMTRCEKLGVACYLIKPIKQSELYEAILMALGMAAVDETSEQEQAPKAAAAHGDELLRRPLTMLLAEDNPLNQKLAVWLLTKHGHQVDVAENGREAVQRYRDGQYDVVLMDVQMPELDGLAATRLIRAEDRKRGRHTPIIAMTAYAMKGDRERCLDAGMDGYLAKPIRPGALFETIGHLLGTETAADKQVSPDHNQPERRDSDADRTKEPEALVNWEIAHQTAMGDEALLAELVDIFLKNTGKLVDEIDQAINANDSGGLLLAAHSLKGNCRAFGAAAPEHLAFHIENTARDGSVDVAQAAQKLQQQIEQVQGELSGWLSRRTLSEATKSVTMTREW